MQYLTLVIDIPIPNDNDKEYDSLDFQELLSTCPSIKEKVHRLAEDGWDINDVIID